MRYYIDLKAIGSIMRNPKYSDKEKVLLYIIADHCQFLQNIGKACQLSYSIIKKWTGWGDHTVQNTIASLVEKGDISYVTEHLKGNRKSTAVVSTGYCRSDSNSTVETAVQGTVVAAVNNKQEKQQRNSTIAESTYSSKCGVTENESSCSESEDTSFLDEVESDCKAKDSNSEESAITKYLNEHLCDGNVMGDIIEWEINQGRYSCDIEVQRVVEHVNKNCDSVQLDPDHYKKLFQKEKEKADRERLVKIMNT